MSKTGEYFTLRIQNKLIDSFILILQEMLWITHRHFSFQSWSRTPYCII